MCLSDIERQVIASPAVLSSANRKLYKRRIRDRLKKMADDIAFLCDNIGQLSSLEIKIDEYLPMLNHHTDNTKNKPVSNVKQRNDKRDSKRSRDGRGR